MANAHNSRLTFNTYGDEPKTKRLQFLDSGGSPRDFSGGWTFLSQVRVNPADPVLATLAVADAGNGELDITWDGDNTGFNATQLMRWDLRGELAGTPEALTESGPFIYEDGISIPPVT